LPDGEVQPVLDELFPPFFEDHLKGSGRHARRALVEELVVRRAGADDAADLVARYDFNGRRDGRL
jgi:hypothetical protein